MKTWFLITGLIFLSSASSGQPTVVVNAVSSVTSTGATFTGAVSANGSPTINRVLLGLTPTSFFDSAGTIPGNQSTKITGQNISVTRTYPGTANNPPALTPNTTYYYAMGAKGDNGLYTRSGVQSFTTPALSAPDSFSAHPNTVNSTELTLMWKGQSEHVRVNGSTTTFPSTPTSATQVFSGNATSVSLSGLTDSTTYYYRIWGKAAASSTYTSGFMDVIVATPGNSGKTGISIPAGYTSRLVPGSNHLVFDITNNTGGAGSLRVEKTIGPVNGLVPESGQAPEGVIFLTSLANVLWTVTPQSLSGITYRLIIDVSQFSGLENPSRLVLLQRASPESSWEPVSNQSGVTVTTDSYNRLILSGLTSFGEFTLGFNEADYTVPVELSSFSGWVSGDQILLNWTTKSELNNYGWEVQKKNSDPSGTSGSGSQNSEEWKTVGFVAGNGTTNSPKSYSFQSPIMVTERSRSAVLKSLFRLKQLDLDGTVSYSQVLSIRNTPSGFQLLGNYPNPFNPATRIRFQLSTSSQVSLQVYDVTGRLVFSREDGALDAGVHSFEFNAAGLSSGLYYYRLQAGNQSAAGSMVVLK
ncbi:MAG: T9SS type A sorting domain-containing protein [Bacteroidetes bacterium]|nr:T9SS type A sorting domain-containing protein [Bacteroidota bacterium]